MSCRPTLRALQIAIPLLLVACNSGGEQTKADLRKPAVFRITTDVVNANMAPFGATVAAFGNSLINDGAGFEPIVYRNKYVALEDSPGRVVVNPSDLTHYDSFREGFLDQATVNVYRIENGNFRMVREDTIPVGGSHASGWLRAIDDNSVLTTPKFTFRWDPWNRPKVPYYFTVRAMDKSGNLSPPASTFRVERPDNVGKGAAANSVAGFKPSKSLFSPEPLRAPTNLRGKVSDEGTLTLEWNPVDARDLAGYVVFRSDYPPQQHSGYYLQLAKTTTSPAQHVKAGDLVFVSKKIYSPSRNRFLSNRVWGASGDSILPELLHFFPDETPGKTWALVPHETNTPVEEGGETCLKLELAAGVSETVFAFNHSGTAQFWYEVLEKKKYKVEVWLKQEGPGSVKFKLTGFYAGGPQKLDPVAFEVGQNWKKYVATFTPQAIQDGSQPSAMVLEFTGPGTFYVDNFRIFLADTEYLDLLPRDYEAIKSSGISFLRTHGPVRTATRTYDMEQFTNSGGAIGGIARGNTLPQMLKVMRSASVLPWLQIEFHMSPREWLGFVEYLAAPYDPLVDTPAAKPWAYKRFKQGQQKPWIDEFEKIYIELGNETWNRLFRPWVFNGMTDAVSGKSYSAGQTYGLFQEHVQSAVQASPYWSRAGLDKRLLFVLGGWESGTTYGRDAAAASPSSSFLTIAAYNGGWDEEEGPPEFNSASLFKVLTQVSQSAIPSAQRHMKEVAALNGKGDRKRWMGTYEAGPGYALNGLNNARVSEEQGLAQEQVMKSLSAGTATVDSFLARAYQGFVLQNFFGFDRGMLWKSHAKWYRGGQAYPSWKALALFNNHATGDMLRTETMSVPSADLQAFDRRQAIRNAPLAAVYATRKAQRFSLFVLSRKLPDFPVVGDDGFTPVSVELPFTRAKSVTLYKMTGDPKANNLLSDNVKIEKVPIQVQEFSRLFTLNPETGADLRGLPPASTFLYVFEGVGVGAKPAP